MINEELLYFAWKFKLYQTISIHSNQNFEIQVIDPGIQNYNAGPDFTETKIKSNETIWVGNAEIHINSSDWYKHGHHLDPAYNNVILQIVLHHDKEIKTQNERIIPVLEIKINQGIEEKFHEYSQSNLFIACANDIQSVNQFKIDLWLSKVLAERLCEKAQIIDNELIKNDYNWEETFYHLIARSFGFKINAEPFEWLAKSIPLKIFAKHHYNLIQTEALLFGQAGFLQNEFEDIEYYHNLKKEYQFLKNKYNLKPLDVHIWKFLRIRPSNFPTIRIAQFAKFICQSGSLFSKIIQAGSVNQLKSFFNIKASGFWDNHYHFKTLSVLKKKTLGNQSQDSILINTVVPILFVYGKLTGNDELRGKAMNFLEKLEPEKNEVINKWKKIGMEIPSAFYTQALLYQKKYYCSSSRCLDCGIGFEIFKNHN